jgi:hypothetical protein
MPEKTEEKFKTLALGEVVKIDADSRSVSACISSEDIDRHGEIVTSAALAAAIKDFAANPVACACHLRFLDNGKPPVIGSWDTGSFRQSGKKSYMTLNFASTELAEEYWQLYRDKHMRAFSISFRPIEWHEEKGKKGYVVIFDKIELTEISPVAIGANRDALSKKLEHELIGLDLEHEATKQLAGKLDTLRTEMVGLSDKMDTILDTLSDRSDFGDALLSFSASSNRNKQTAEKDNAEELSQAEIQSLLQTIA